MNQKEMTNQLLLVVVAIVCALLSIGGHLILSKSFSQFAWVEYTAAAIPFIMLGLCLFAFRSAIKASKQ